jgi:spore cortex formation protein SpoVR/YcgB (stage V sporulation)
MENKKKYITESADWTVDTLKKFDEVIQKYAKEYLKLDWYPNQFEIVSSEQMLDAYSLIGLPISYPHWKFGKDFMSNAVNYEKGRQGLAYELVINSNPCISYNMEDNSSCMMALVIAHAAYGHNSFFKCNYMFKEWTDADNIIEDMVYARDFILKCEDKYGIDAVEDVLDSCHALQRFGVDKIKRPKRRTKESEDARRKLVAKLDDENYNILWDTLPEDVKFNIEWAKRPKSTKHVKLKEDNILFFLENNTPNLPLWQKEIISIVRNIGQYFYPQSQTKVINEGWATFTHYTLINKLYEEGYLNEGFMIEFIKSHTGVIAQPAYSSKYYSGLNPYTLGFNIFMDIKRICEDPTEEDKRWFPNLIGKDWLEEITYAMENFRDDSFILQYLSPKVIRDMKLFLTVDLEDDSENYHVEAIHNDKGYRDVREALYKQYQRSNYMPTIRVTDVDTYDNNKLVLTHLVEDGKLLNEDDAMEVLELMQNIWKFPIELNAKFETGEEINLVELDY